MIDGSTFQSNSNRLSPLQLIELEEIRLLIESTAHISQGQLYITFVVVQCQTQTIVMRVLKY